MIQHPASFRDPSGYLFSQDEKLYRVIYPSYFAEFAQVAFQSWRKSR